MVVMNRFLSVIYYIIILKENVLGIGASKCIKDFYRSNLSFKQNPNLTKTFPWADGNPINGFRNLHTII